MDWHIALAGLLVGTAVGFSGVGGSALMMPVLVLMLGVQPLIAVGTDLAYSVPTKLVGMLVHWRQQAFPERSAASSCSASSRRSSRSMRSTSS